MTATEDGPLWSGSGFGVHVPSNTTSGFCANAKEANSSNRAARGSKRLLVGCVAVSNWALGGFTALHLILLRFHFVRGCGAGFRINGGNGEAKSQCQNNVAHIASSLTDLAIQNLGNPVQNRNQ